LAYIYIIKNDINNKVYIGKTAWDINKRFKEHCRDSEKRKNEKRPLYNAMNKYGIEHFYIELIEECSIEKASQREQFWIQYFNSFKNGYNATLGGDGKNYLDYNKILKYYDETNLTQIQIAEQCNCSVSSVMKIISQYRKNPNWRERANKINSKQVLCIEKNIKFNSIGEASRWLFDIEKTTNISSMKQHISEVCRNKRKTAGSFSWKYV